MLKSFIKLGVYVGALIHEDLSTITTQSMVSYILIEGNSLVWYMGKEGLMGKSPDLFLNSLLNVSFRLKGEDSRCCNKIRRVRLWPFSPTKEPKERNIPLCQK